MYINIKNIYDFDKLCQSLADDNIVILDYYYIDRLDGDYKVNVECNDMTILEMLNILKEYYNDCIDENEINENISEYELH